MCDDDGVEVGVQCSGLVFFWVELRVLRLRGSVVWKFHHPRQLIPNVYIVYPHLEQAKHRKHYNSTSFCKPYRKQADFLTRRSFLPCRPIIHTGWQIKRYVNEIELSIDEILKKQYG